MDHGMDPASLGREYPVLSVVAHLGWYEPGACIIPIPWIDSQSKLRGQVGDGGCM